MSELPARREAQGVAVDVGGKESARGRGVFARLLPLIRQTLWAPDGQPPLAWSEARECSVLKRLLVHRNVSQVETAILGLVALRDRGQIDWLPRGQKVTSRALYCTRSGVSQMFELATREYWHTVKRTPRAAASQVGSILFEMVQRSAQRSTGYKAYLQTPQWRMLREQVLARAAMRCEQCRRYGCGLDVHHRTYERFGDERLEDLEALCRPCHDQEHQR